MLSLSQNYVTPVHSYLIDFVQRQFPAEIKAGEFFMTRREQYMASVICYVIGWLRHIRSWRAVDCGSGARRLVTSKVMTSGWFVFSRIFRKRITRVMKGWILSLSMLICFDSLWSFWILSHCVLYQITRGGCVYNEFKSLPATDDILCGEGREEWCFQARQAPSDSPMMYISISICLCPLVQSDNVLCVQEIVTLLFTCLTN